MLFRWIFSTLYDLVDREWHMLEDNEERCLSSVCSFNAIFLEDAETDFSFRFWLVFCPSRSFPYSFDGGVVMLLWSRQAKRRLDCSRSFLVRTVGPSLSNGRRLLLTRKHCGCFRSRCSRLHPAAPSSCSSLIDIIFIMFSNRNEPWPSKFR